jgi:hypothetical protein
VHTELVGRLGWLDRVFVTPSNHRVHHGQNDYCIDRNYGGIFILFDRLFGTFADERDDERIIYGVRSPLRSLNPAWANLHYYAACGRPRDRYRAGAKTAGLAGRPAPGPVSRWATSSRPASSTTPCHAARRRLYAMFQFALLVPCISHFLALAPTLAAALLAYAA